MQLCPHLVFLEGQELNGFIHFTVITSSKALSLNIASRIPRYWWLGLQYVNLGGGGTFKQITTFTQIKPDSLLVVQNIIEFCKLSICIGINITSTVVLFIPPSVETIGNEYYFVLIFLRIICTLL